MPVKRYARQAGGVLSGASAALFAYPRRQQPTRSVDWDLLQRGLLLRTRSIRPEPGSVVAISLTVEYPPSAGD